MTQEEDIDEKLQSLKLYPLSLVLERLKVQRGAFEYSRCVEKQKRQKTDPGVVVKRKVWPSSMYHWLYSRQNGECPRCHTALDMPATKNALDHIVPLAKGGRDKKFNLCLLHQRCNSSKGANDILTESKRTGQGFNEIMERGGHMTGEENEV